MNHVGPAQSVRAKDHSLGPIHVPYLLTQVGGHSCGPELYNHRHAGRERLPRAGGVRDISRDLSAYLIPDPPARPKKLGQTVCNGCPLPPSCYPGACGLQEGDQSLAGVGGRFCSAPQTQTWLPARRKPAVEN